MSLFVKNLEELLYLSRKHSLVRYLERNYRENIHYIVEKVETTTKGQRGGHNKINYYITEQVYELIKNSYNLRNRYLVNLNENIKQVKLSMCIENQTIGFIENAYKNIFKMHRQFKIGKYKVDLCFIDLKIVVECDEFNHIQNDINKEKMREIFIKTQGYDIIRFNPNEENFDLSNVLNHLNIKLFLENKEICSNSSVK